MLPKMVKALICPSVSHWAGSIPVLGVVWLQVMVFGGEEAGDLDAPGHALVALQQFFEVAFQELHPSD